VDLLTIGEAFDDLVMAGLPRLPRLGEELRVATLSQHPGGGALITGVGCARLGLDVGLMSAVSRRTTARLREEGLTLVNLRRASEPSAVTVALSTPHDRAFVTFDGVNAVLEPRLLGAVTHRRRWPRHVHFALGPRRCRDWVAVVSRLQEKSVTTSWDFGWHEHLVNDASFLRLLATLDWVFVNEREAALYARARDLGSAVKRWRGMAKRTVIKRGARGALAVGGRGAIRSGAFKVKPVDTTGAGDAFNAGFLSALLANAPIDRALRLGNYLGAHSTLAAGGVDGLRRRPTLPAWATRILEAA
jgi:sugar/nucleoside kinase (ribokinase family)